MASPTRKNWLLSPAQKADARAAYALIGDRALTLADCVRIALQIDRETTSSVKTDLTAAVTEFIAWSISQNVRQKTAQFYEDQLWPFARTYAGATLDDFTRAALKKYLETLPGSRANKEARHRGVRALFRWAARQDPPKVSRDPTVGLVLDLPHVDRKIGFLTVDEAEAGLRAALPGHRAALAIMLFAGVRPEELRGDGKPPMPWRCVNVVNKTVAVPPECAKVRNAGRILDGLPRNLWTWLPNPLPDGKEPILAVEPRNIVEAVKALNGYGPKPLRKWPHDALRHTFATYHLAHYRDPGRTAKLLGHRGDTELLHARYAAADALAAEGKRFFGLVVG